MTTLTLTQTQAMGRLHLRLIGKERTSDILVDDDDGAGSKKRRVKRGMKYTPKQIIWMCIVLSGVILISTWLFMTFNKIETGTSRYDNDTSATASLPVSHAPIEAKDRELEDSKEQNRRLRLSPEQIRRNTLPDKVLECCRSLVRAGNLNCNKCGKYMHEN